MVGILYLYATASTARGASFGSGCVFSNFLASLSDLTPLPGSKGTENMGDRIVVAENLSENGHVATHVMYVLKHMSVAKKSILLRVP